MTATMRAWQVVRYGRPSDALELVDVPIPEPGPGEVRVRVAASALNFNEVDGCRGRYLTVNPPLPYTLGMEAVGEVVAGGSGAEAWVGQRVMCTAAGAFGAHADQVIASAAMTFPVPGSLDDTDAAAFFFPFHLAYLGLHERAGLRAGETVLIHAAAGGVGSAAVQLAVAAGARVIATAGGAGKLELARSLGAEVAIDYRSGGFVDEVLQATDGRGVDVCFDGVGGQVMLDSLRCLARNGRHLVVGFASGIEAEEVPMVSGRMLCFGSISLMGVILAYGDPGSIPPGSGFHPVPRQIGEQIHHQLTELLDRGQIRPLVGQVIEFADLPAGLEAMEDRVTTGRIVVTRPHGCPASIPPG